MRAWRLRRPEVFFIVAQAYRVRVISRSLTPDDVDLETVLVDRCIFLRIPDAETRVDLAQHAQHGAIDAA